MEPIDILFVSLGEYKNNILASIVRVVPIAVGIVVSVALLYFGLNFFTTIVFGKSLAQIMQYKDDDINPDQTNSWGDYGSGPYETMATIHTDEYNAYKSSPAFSTQTFEQFIASSHNFDAGHNELDSGKDN